MNAKSLVWLGMFLGSSIGSFIPFLWGADLFSFSSILLGAIGGLIGIWLAFKVSQ